MSTEIFFCSSSSSVHSEMSSFFLEPTANIPLASFTIEHVEFAVQLLERIFTLAS